MTNHITTQFHAAQGGSALTMSSREIAELTGKEHKNVIRDIRSMLTGLSSEPSAFEGSYQDSTGRFLPCFNLPKRETLILVSGYDVGLRAKIVDRWIELESGAAPRSIDYSDPKVMLGVVQHLVAQVAEKDAVIASQAGDVAALDRIAKSDGSLCITDAAKTLQVRPKDLFSFLRSHRWIYTRAGSNQEIAYQTALASGLLEHKTTTVERSDGTEKSVTQIRVTPKGLARLAKEFPSPLSLVG